MILNSVVIRLCFWIGFARTMVLWWEKGHSLTNSTFSIINDAGLNVFIRDE
jgi:hypothetical protein